MMALLILVLTILSATIIQRRLPDCLSDCYYSLGVFFTFAMLAIAMSMMPQMIDITPEPYKALAFLTCGGIAFVGAAANYKDKTTYPVHKWAALTSAVCSIAWVLVVNPLALSALSIATVGLIDHQRWLLYCELACFAAVILTLQHYY